MRFTLFLAFALLLLPAVLTPSIEIALDRVKASYAPLRGEMHKFDRIQPSGHKKPAELTAYVEQ